MSDQKQVNSQTNQKRVSGKKRKADEITKSVSGHDELAEFIVNLQFMIDSKALNPALVSQPSILISALNELLDMIGLDKVKAEIVRLVKYLLYVGKPLNKDDMLHIVINGPPGTGKTTVARIISKIIGAMDILKTPILPAPEKKDIQALTPVISLDAIMTRMKCTALLDKYNKGLDVVKKELLHLGYDLADSDLSTLKNIECLSKLLKIYHMLDEVNKSDEKIKTYDVVVANRETVIAGYTGQTAIKTKDFLERNFGNVIIFDEAYNLISNDLKDSFGMEALTIINEYMSVHYDKLVIIFAGYKDLMKQTIFKAQPGLERRITWFFDIDEYNEDALAQIFITGLKRVNFSLDPNINIKAFFKGKKKQFTNYGGDVIRLVLQAKMCYTSYVFDQAIHGKIYKGQVINQAILDSAYKRYTDNQDKQPESNIMSSLYM